MPFLVHSVCTVGESCLGIMSVFWWQSFTVKEKLKIVVDAEERGNRAATGKHDIDDSCIRDWQEEKNSKLRTGTGERFAA